MKRNSPRITLSERGPLTLSNVSESKPSPYTMRPPEDTSRNIAIQQITSNLAKTLYLKANTVSLTKNPNSTSYLRMRQIQQKDSSQSRAQLLTAEQFLNDEDVVKDEINDFEEKLTKIQKRGFSAMSRQESMILKDSAGYRKVKEVKKNKQYPYIRQPF